MNSHRQIHDLASILRTSPYYNFTGVIQQYLTFVESTVESEGKQAILRLKAYKDFLLKAISTGNFKVPRGKLRKLKPVVRLAQQMILNNDQKYLFILMTVVRSYDLYHPSEKVINSDFEEFKSKCLTSDIQDLKNHRNKIRETFPTSEFTDYIKEISPYIKDNILKLKRPLEDAILLSKKGTVKYENSFLPSIVGALYEYREIEENYPILKKAIIDMQNMLGKPFGYGSSWPKCDYRKHSKETKALLRRNAAFGAPGFKTRIVGIADYPTQYTLEPIHRSVMSLLNMIPNDYTHDHDEGFQNLNEISGKINTFCSCFDLSSATDMFPAFIQAHVLDTLYGKEIARNWYHLMVMVPFDNLYYKIGQPMGILSSWTVFAFCHHLIISFAASRISGKSISPFHIRKNLYGMVGDDIFITNPNLALEYSKLIQALGVPINMSKSLTLDNSRGVSEFVKRNSLRGIEISGISPRIVMRAISNDYPSLRTLVNILITRFSNVQIDDFIDFVASKSSPLVKQWINANKSIPYEIGGLWFSNSREPLASPDLIIASMHAYAKANVKFAFRGPLMNNQGRIVTDDLTYYSAIVPQLASVDHTPIVLYNRRYSKSALEKVINDKSSRLLNLIDDIYSNNREFGSEYLVMSESYENFILILDESTMEEYQSTKIHEHISRDYIHKFEKSIKWVINGCPAVQDFKMDKREILEVEDYYSKMFSESDENLKSSEITDDYIGLEIENEFNESKPEEPDPIDKLLPIEWLK